jgi:hypothetical protein
MPIINQRLREDIGKKSLLHAVLFPLSIYSNTDCLNWLKIHNLHPIHNRYTKNYHRFRIRDVISQYKFYTVVLNNGIELIYMFQSN